jgi:DNA-binding transcriptional LysR family regulator
LRRMPYVTFCVHRDVACPPGAGMLTLECAMTLTQLNAFVLVARLGSVRAAAGALSVSESAVSQAITALRQDLGDHLITRSQAGMTLTPGGTRLLGIASQIVMLGADAHAAVRDAQGAPEQLRVVATSTFAEFVAGPLMEAFRRRYAGPVEVTTGVAASGEQAVLIANRLADVAHLQVPAGGGRPGEIAAARAGQAVALAGGPVRNRSGQRDGQAAAPARGCR